MKLHRSGVGYEIDPHDFDLARKRVQNDGMKLSRCSVEFRNAVEASLKTAPA